MAALEAAIQEATDFPGESGWPPQGRPWRKSHNHAGWH